MDPNKKKKMPEKNDEDCIQDMVIDDIKERKKIGVEKYGTVLKPFNGRNSIVDLYQELGDALVYCKQMMIEREEMVKMLKYIAFSEEHGCFVGRDNILELLEKLGEIE